MSVSDGIDPKICCYPATSCFRYSICLVCVSHIRKTAFGILGLPTPLSSFTVRNDTADDISNLKLATQTQALLTRPRSQTRDAVIMGKLSKLSRFIHWHAQHVRQTRGNVRNGDLWFLKGLSQKQDVEGVFHLSRCGFVLEPFQRTLRSKRFFEILSLITQRIVIFATGSAIDVLSSRSLNRGHFVGMPTVRRRSDLSEGRPLSHGRKCLASRKI
mmetsp:Transcript_38700/g.59692  ORF Transcript_38700/g.59692 Transcript_38700/m.59692 type:complete len:215 (-) Transcript_38700:155-799(-)